MNGNDAVVQENRAGDCKVRTGFKAIRGEQHDDGNNNNNHNSNLDEGLPLKHHFFGGRGLEYVPR